jgi:uncharacterized membrane protein YdbT with pleckstrin-like domain
MSYPKKLLNDHETVALDMHPHWWHFSPPAAALLGSVVLGIVSLFWPSGDAGTAVGWIAIVLIVGSALWLLARYAQYATTNFVITSDRIIYRSGVFAKSGIEIPLERVNNVLFSQSIFERLLGAGDLMIESGGMEGQQRFSDIKHPDEVQRTIHAQIDASKGRSGRSAGGGSDVASQLEKLEGMLERGTLSQDEFEREKRRLLGG